MKSLNTKSRTCLVLSLIAIVACSNSKVKTDAAAGGLRGVHFKVDGKPYDISFVRSIYDKSSHVFAIYNSGLPGFPDTTITVGVGSNFTGASGTFPSTADTKGFVFGFFLLNKGLQNMPICGYVGGKDEGNGGATVANTPIRITINSFSPMGSPGAANGNVTAQGTFSGTVYDIKNKNTVALTDGAFNIFP